MIRPMHKPNKTLLFLGILSIFKTEPHAQEHVFPHSLLGAARQGYQHLVEKGFLNESGIAQWQENIQERFSNKTSDFQIIIFQLYNYQLRALRHGFPEKDDKRHYQHVLRNMVRYHNHKARDYGLLERYFLNHKGDPALIEAAADDYMEPSTYPRNLYQNLLQKMIKNTKKVEAYSTERSKLLKQQELTEATLQEIKNSKNSHLIEHQKCLENLKEIENQLRECFSTLLNKRQRAENLEALLSTTQQVEEYENEKKKLLEMSQEYRSQIESQEKSITSLEHPLQEVAQEIIPLQAEISSLLLRKSSILRASGDVQNERALPQSQGGSQSQETSNASSVEKNISQEMDQLLEKLANKYQVKETLEKKIESLQKENEKWEKDRVIFHQKIQTLSQSIQSLTKQVNTLKNHLGINTEDEKDIFYQENLSDLLIEIDALTIKHTELNENLKVIREKVIASEEKTKRLDKEIEDVSQPLGTYIYSLNVVEDKINEAKHRQRLASDKVGLYALSKFVTYTSQVAAISTLSESIPEEEEGLPLLPNPYFSLATEMLQNFQEKLKADYKKKYENFLDLREQQRNQQSVQLHASLSQDEYAQLTQALQYAQQNNKISSEAFKNIIPKLETFAQQEKNIPSEPSMRAEDVLSPNIHFNKDVKKTLTSFVKEMEQYDKISISLTYHAKKWLARIPKGSFLFQEWEIEKFISTNEDASLDRGSLFFEQLSKNPEILSVKYLKKVSEKITAKGKASWETIMKECQIKEIRSYSFEKESKNWPRFSSIIRYIDNKIKNNRTKLGYKALIQEEDSWSAPAYALSKFITYTLFSWNISHHYDGTPLNITLLKADSFFARRALKWAKILRKEHPSYVLDNGLDSWIFLGKKIENSGFTI